MSVWTLLLLLCSFSIYDSLIKFLLSCCSDLLLLSLASALATFMFLLSSPIWFIDFLPLC